jgi:hypothetical protein
VTSTAELSERIARLEAGSQIRRLVIALALFLAGESRTITGEWIVAGAGGCVLG